jgi:hypothetical protein
LQLQFAAFLGVGVTSTVLSTIIIGITSQVWLRAYHRGWYKKYNYILGGALDGGAQTMIFILSFAVYGAAGVERPFPKVSLSISMMYYLLVNGFLDSGLETLRRAM